MSLKGHHGYIFILVCEDQTPINILKKTLPSKGQLGAKQNYAFTYSFLSHVRHTFFQMIEQIQQAVPFYKYLPESMKMKLTKITLTVSVSGKAFRVTGQK